MIATITKKSVKETQPNLYSISLNMICKEGTAEIINQDLSVSYWKGQSAVDAINGIKNEMQKVVDKYKREQAILVSTQLDTAVTDIQNSLIL